MSGLEGLGAAASIIGVIGAVKTCIDLLDILSTARSAERDLEDLLVHLEWQRIRFYCWVVETGFSNIIVADARDVTNGARRPQTITENQQLALLPREFRLSFFLAHIERTIGNMNNRLQATEQLVQRYCGKHSRSSSAVVRSWTERLGQIFDPGSAKTRALSPQSPLQTGAIGARKLAIWDKVRWVAGDVKELNYLVGTLRQYNTELAEMLPPSRSRSLERRVERELITSPNMIRLLNSPSIDDRDQTENHTVSVQVTKYRSLVSLLERQTKVQSDGGSGNHGGRDHNINLSGIKFSRDLSSAPLRLTCADLTFRDPISGRAEREFVQYQQTPTIVEWRYYPTRASKQERSYIDARVHGLSMQLYQLSIIGEVWALPCLGYVHDERNLRYGHLFTYPRDYDGLMRPTSLEERLRRDHANRLRCELQQRFEIARSLVLAVYRLLSVNWLHKNLTSENVLLFNESGEVEDSGSGEPGLCRPYVCGFGRSRRDAQLELSEKPATAYGDSPYSQNERLYWHPGRLALVEAVNGHGESTISGSLLAASYRREFDVYGLGILLLEIGLWYPIKRIFRDCKLQSPVAFAQELRTQYIPKLSGRMGKLYADMVAFCLEDKTGGDGLVAASEDTEDEYMLRTKHFLEMFEKKVVAKMESLNQVE